MIACYAYLTRLNAIEPCYLARKFDGGTSGCTTRTADLQKTFFLFSLLHAYGRPARSKNRLHKAAIKSQANEKQFCPMSVTHSLKMALSSWSQPNMNGSPISRLRVAISDPCISEQSVSHATLSKQVLRLCRVCLQFLPEVTHINPEIVTLL